MGRDKSATPEIEVSTTQVEAELKRFLIAPRRSLAARRAGIAPMSAAGLTGLLSTLGLDVVRTIQRSSKTLATMSAGPGEATHILVTRMERERADLIKSTLPANLILAEDRPLDYTDLVYPRSALTTPAAACVTRNLRFRILGKDDQPLAGVTVILAGDAYPAQGVTNEAGEIQLDLQTLGDRPPRVLWVQAPNGYWDLYLNNAKVSDASINVIRLRSFVDTINGFPQQFQFGWGQRVMGLDQAPRGINGAGVKIAIIDSGCDNTHPLLGHVRLGQDFSDAPGPKAWNLDQIGHGTHCAGVITARSTDGSMLHGFAPEAEIHILKVFPGGAYSNLIEALDYCIDNQIDVVNMSLGGDATVNEVVQETLEMAALNGIACIVASGNSGDAVKFPARSPHVLAVGAVGSLKDLPPNLWEGTTVRSELVAPDGIFAPSFSCFGPEIAVCAPGVAIVSTVPGGGFKSESGTSMAAPHITGVAALLLAHHPLFQTQFRAHDHNRVVALAQMLRAICQFYPFGFYSGAGLPILTRVLPELKPAGELVGAHTAPMAVAGAATAMAQMAPASFNPMQVLPWQVGAPYFPYRQ